MEARSIYGKDTKHMLSSANFLARHTIRRHALSLVAGCLAFALSSTIALAIDGRIEISQTAILAGGITPGDAPGYPATLSASGSYVLTSDLILPSSSGMRGIEIEGGPAQLDLNGFSILGPGTCTGIPPVCSGSQITVGIEISTSEPVEISNGTLTGLFSAVNVLTTTGSETRSTVLKDLAIEANSGTAVFMSGNGSSVIRDCQINRNGLLGIDIDIGHTVLIDGVTFRSNGSSAIDSQGSASLVLNSLFVGNSIGIRSFFISNPSLALVYGGNSFFANTTHVIGGSQLGPNLCAGAPCP